MKQGTKITYKGKIAYGAGIVAVAVVAAIGFSVPAQARQIPAYVCSINGEEIGIVASGQMFNNALSEARVRVAEKNDEVVYFDVDYSLKPTKSAEGKLLGEKELNEIVYNAVMDAEKNSKEKAYTIKIGQFTVIVGSKEEAIALLNEAKAPYDTFNEFYTELIQDTTKDVTGYTVRLSRTHTLTEEGRQSCQAGVANELQIDQVSHNAELINLAFAQKIEIVECCVSEDQITPYADAIASITKEKEKNKVYEVQSGDCLSLIAQKTDTSVDRIMELNQLSGSNPTLHAGDEIIVTVPEPELTVLKEVEVTYEEEYTKVEYIDNDSWFTTREEVRQEGTPGKHRMTDRVTYENGIEIARNNVDEVILEQSTPTIIERGTITPPTFVKPLSNGRFTSGFKKRWGRMHKGVDWACPIGTAIKASCAGVVVQSGWSNGYGYCITLKHADGKQTRYGHLKKTLVSVGQTVSQGEKIGLSGNTGRSTGPHLHFEIIVNGSQVDPFKYLK